MAAQTKTAGKDFRGSLTVPPYFNRHTYRKVSSMNNITLDQRLAIAKAYLDENISLRTIADLAGVNASDIARISREVLGDKYFKTRYKSSNQGTGTLL